MCYAGGAALAPNRLVHGRMASRSVALSIVLAVSTPAAAQENNSFAVGVSVTGRDAIHADAHGSTGFGLKWRIGHSESGWGWHYGLNWYSTHLDRQIAGRETEFGELHVRPVLAGYGYTYAITDRLSASAIILGGAAMTKFDLTPEATDAFHAMALQSVRATSGFTPVVKPDVGVWYDLNRRFGVSFDVSYLVARPHITVSTSAGRESSRFRADILSLSVGIVYRIF